MMLARLVLSCLALAISFGALAQGDPEFARLAKSAGQPQIPGLRIVYMTSLGDPAQAPWKNIILHQTEGAPGAAKSLAEGQARNPTKRGVTLWVETDGTIYWSVPETVVTTQGDGANRNDNKYIDNSTTFQKVLKTNSVGVEFVGNYPDVAKPVTPWSCHWRTCSCSWARSSSDPAWRVRTMTSDPSVQAAAPGGTGPPIHNR